MVDAPPTPRVVPLPQAVAKLYEAVAELEASYPGRKFTLDGHLVGSIGEVIARETFGFELLSMSARAHDARCALRGNVQVKITAGRAIGLRHRCDHLIVLKIISPREAFILYDGPGEPVWSAAGKMQSNGQRFIALSKLLRI